MRLLLTILCAALAAAFPARAIGADIDDVRNSQWSSTYQDNDGTFAVDATIVLNGDSGTYTLANGDTGVLTGIRYAYITAKPELKVGVYGTWKLGNESGGFTFRVSGDGKQFAGQWTGPNKKRGAWSGSRQ